MTVRPSEKSPLARLVLFIICLAFAGSFVAAVHYLAVDLPAQTLPASPLNRGTSDACLICENQLLDCMVGCDVKHPEWDLIGRNVCHNWCVNHFRANCYAPNQCRGL